ncbi:MAG TPA: MopE-related protein [Pyrinomonadaceae bacterium]|nr:MopE-related protein [Pyrinomonadaceae bacterium]
MSCASCAGAGESDDKAQFVYPRAAEMCNCEDDNCNGMEDENWACQVLSVTALFATGDFGIGVPLRMAAAA